ncbi:MAG TPA: hypothetical protein VNR20_03305 [Terriglobales bacterium]|nr:hypothetical protein [Terriglobales bacterium]
MPKYRVEVEEREIVTREQWFEASSEAEARALAEEQDWRTFSEVDRDTQAEITIIEEA